MKPAAAFVSMTEERYRFDGAWMRIRDNVIMRIVSEMRVTEARFRTKGHEIFRGCVGEGIRSVVQNVIKIRANSVER